MAHRRTTILPWTPAVAELFAMHRLVGKDWTAPNTVKRTSGVRAATLTARYRQPDGTIAEAILRVRRDVKGGGFITGETLRIRLTTNGRPTFT